MLLETELALEGAEDGLDLLADPPEVSDAGLLVDPVRAKQVRAEVLGDEGLEVAPGEA